VSGVLAGLRFVPVNLIRSVVHGFPRAVALALPRPLYHQSTISAADHLSAASRNDTSSFGARRLSAQSQAWRLAQRPFFSTSNLLMRLMSSGGALAIVVTALSASSPLIGLTSIFRRVASLRNCGSWWTRRKAACSAIARSLGMPGGAAKGRES